MKKKVSPIVTERLQLKEMTLDDAEKVVRLRGDPRVYQYFSSPHAITLEEHLKWFLGQYVSDESRYDWIAYLDNDAIGVFAVKRNKSILFEAELNYWLKPEKWGAGYAKEAVRALLQWVVLFWDIRVVTATIHHNNYSSKSFAEKMGFVPMRTKKDFIIYEKTL